MFWTLVRKELLANLLSLRLAVAVVLTVVLCVLTTLIGSLEYSGRVQAYQEALREERRELEEASVYRQLGIDLLFPPRPLSILCRGISESAGYRLSIYVDWRPFPPVPIGSFGGAGGDLMRTLAQADFATAIALVLSLLAVVLGFDAVCGERERGTLAQVLANPVPRARVIFAKLAGGLLSLWIPLALAFALALLVLQANPDVHFAGDDWVRLALFFVLSCLFLGQVFSLSLMVSTFAQRPATSLVACLFAWMALGTGYASVLPSLARYGVREEPAYAETLALNKELWEGHLQALAAWEAEHPPPGPAYMKAWEQGQRIRYGHPLGYLWRQQRNAFDMSGWLQSADERHRLWEAQQRPLAREAFLVDEWSLLSPFTTYQVLAYQLAGTTLEERFYLRAVGEEYRRALLDFLRARDAFASRRWFSDDPEGHEPMIAEPEKASAEMLAADSPFMQARLEWAREQEQRIAAQGGRRLDLSGLPDWERVRRRPLSSSLAAMAPGLAAMALSWSAGVLAALWRFATCDPR